MDFHYGRWTPILAFALALVNQLAEARSQPAPEWKAEKNWLTELDRATLKQMMNAPSDELDSWARFEIQSNRENKVELISEKWDWRSTGNQNYVSPVRNQGICGSCVAFAMTGALETQNNISSQLPALNSILSAEALFSCGGATCQGSLSPNIAIRYLATNGVPDEACAPHQMGATGHTMSCNSICADSQSRSLKITNFNRPSNGYQFDLNAVKTALKKGPLVSLMRIYSDFLTYRSGVYSRTNEDLIGSHAVVIVGFDDSKKAWIIKNSWGSSWGENGFAYVSYDDLDTAVGIVTWAMDIPENQDRVYIESPANREVLTGVVKFKAGTNIALSKSIRTQLFHASTGQKIASSECIPGADKKCETTFELSRLVEGKYYALSETVTSSGVNTSTPHEFYVLHSQPNIKITWKENINSSGSKKDFLSFRVSTTGSQVPFTQLSLKATNTDGSGDSYIRTTDMIAPDMIVKMKTSTIRPGWYQLKLVGTIKTNKTNYTFSSDSIRLQIKPTL